MQRSDRRRIGHGGHRIEQRGHPRSRAARRRGAVRAMTTEPMKIGSTPQSRACAVLTHEGGLHARPAIKLTQLAKRYDAAVWIALTEHGPWTDAKSIARVMAMKTP